MICLALFGKRRGLKWVSAGFTRVSITLHPLHKRPYKRPAVRYARRVPKPLSPLPADPHPEGVHLMNDQYMTQKTTQTIHNQYVCRCFSPPPAWFQHNSPCVIRPYYNALRPLSPCSVQWTVLFTMHAWCNFMSCVMFTVRKAAQHPLTFQYPSRDVSWPPPPKKTQQTQKWTFVNSFLLCQISFAKNITPLYFFTRTFSA